MIHSFYQSSIYFHTNNICIHICCTPFPLPTSPLYHTGKHPSSPQYTIPDRYLSFLLHPVPQYQTIPIRQSYSLLHPHTPLLYHTQQASIPHPKPQNYTISFYIPIPHWYFIPIRVRHPSSSSIQYPTLIPLPSRYTFSISVTHLTVREHLAGIIPPSNIPYLSTIIYFTGMKDSCQVSYTSWIYQRVEEGERMPVRYGIGMG